METDTLSRSTSPHEDHTVVTLTTANSSSNNNNNINNNINTTNSTSATHVSKFNEPSHTSSFGEPKSPNSSANLGVTQSIRAKLQFFDDNKWKRFSARRLELIDELGLSSKKASEQDDKINEVSEKLRTEYGFSSDTRSDFDRLVRAAIQSVRRNRKRTQRNNSLSSHIGNGHMDLKKRRGSTSSPSQAIPAYTDSHHNINSDLQQQQYYNHNHNHNNNNNNNNNNIGNRFPPYDNGNNSDKLSIASLVSDSSPTSDGMDCVSPDTRDSTDTSLPPLSKLFVSYRDNFFIASIDRLLALTRKVNTNSKHGKLSSGGNSISYNTTTPTASSFQFNSCDNRKNLEFLGNAIISSSIALSIERKGIINSFVAEEIRCSLSSFSISSSLARSLRMSSIEELKHILGMCSIDFGFDATINCVTNVFYELMCLKDEMGLSDNPSFESLLAHFPCSRNFDALAGVESTTESCTSNTTRKFSHLDSCVRPVTLRFQDSKFDFTYNPRANTPPTVAELVDNGRNAFKIAPHRALSIRNANRGGKILATDSDVAEAFTEMHIDLELSSIDSADYNQQRSVLPKFQELL